jgi:hypothetical protein
MSVDRIQSTPGHWSPHWLQTVEFSAPLAGATCGQEAQAEIWRHVEESRNRHGRVNPCRVVDCHELGRRKSPWNGMSTSRKRASPICCRPVPDRCPNALKHRGLHCAGAEPLQGLLAGLSPIAKAQWSGTTRCARGKGLGSTRATGKCAAGSTRLRVDSTGRDAPRQGTEPRKGPAGLRARPSRASEVRSGMCGTRRGAYPGVYDRFMAGAEKPTTAGLWVTRQ